MLCGLIFCRLKYIFKKQQLPIIFYGICCLMNKNLKINVKFIYFKVKIYFKLKNF